MEYIKLCLWVDNKQVKSSWVRIKGQMNKGDTVLGVFSRPPEQEKVDEAFYRELEAASQSQAPVLVGDFNYPDTDWRNNR